MQKNCNFRQMSQQLIWLSFWSKPQRTLFDQRNWQYSSALNHEFQQTCKIDICMATFWTFQIHGSTWAAEADHLTMTSNG